MRNKVVLLALMLTVCPAVHASAVVATTLSLSSLQITPTIGTVQIFPGVFGSVFAGVLDSLGEADSNFDFNFDGPASTSATTSLANANAAANGALLTASAVSGVNISGLTANASTDPNSNAQLSGTFEIVDTVNAGNNPVSVLFSAALALNQSLLTDLTGVSATSEVTFQFSLPDIPAVPFLLYDNLLVIGSNQSSSTASTPTVSQSTVLLTNTSYSFFVETDSESSGVNSVTPEPASMLLAAVGLVALAVVRARRD